MNRSNRALRVPHRGSGWLGGRLLAAAALVVSMAAALAVAHPSTALAKSYTVTDVAINAVVTPSGDMAVDETRTLDFNGDFTFVYWDLSTKGSTGIAVSGLTGPDGKPMSRLNDAAQAVSHPAGTYLVTPGDGTAHVEAYFRATGSNTFHLRYVAKGAAKRWADTSELYWQFVGAGWAVPTGHVGVTIQLPSPSPKSAVKAWAHGPLTGVVRIVARDARASNVTLDVSDVPANTFIEGRVLFPTAALSAAPAAGGARLASVLKEEGALADQANAQRRSAGMLVMFAWVFVVVASLLGVGIAVYGWLRFGREHKTEFVGKYFRDIPDDLPPATVGALMRWGKGTTDDIAATLMDMSRTGIVRLEPVTETEHGLFGPKEIKTYKLTVDRAKLAGAPGPSQWLANFVFNEMGGGDEITLEAMKAKAKSSPSEYKSGVDAWFSLVKKDADSRGFFEATGNLWTVLLWVLAVVVGAITWGMAVWSGAIELWLVGIPAVVIIIILARFAQRRSPTGNELFAKYTALRNYLNDFSRLDEAPPAAVILWEQFLVLAVVFGIAKEVIVAMRVKVPDVLQDPALAPTYWWLASNSWGGSPIDAVSGGFASASSIASSELSSSSGGGGGFSGGGGGGGGGGAG